MQAMETWGRDGDPLAARPQAVVMFFSRYILTLHGHKPTRLAGVGLSKRACIPPSSFTSNVDTDSMLQVVAGMTFLQHFRG